MKDIEKELNFFTTRLEVLAGNFEELGKNWAKELQANTSSFKEASQKLDSSVYSIGKFVESFEQENQQFASKICEDVSRVLRESATEILKESLNKNMEELEKLQVQVKVATKELYEFQGSRFKKSLKNFAMMLVVSIIVSGASSYLLMQKLPTKFHLNYEGGMNIERSQVHIWANRSNIITDSKNIKKTH